MWIFLASFLLLAGFHVSVLCYDYPFSQDPRLPVASSSASSSSSSKRPAIIDTDIGTFIDDSFAIVFAAQSQVLDIKLVVTCTDDTTARAKVTAKLLRMLGRDDIPIGVGIKTDPQSGFKNTLFDWASGENLTSYKGGVFTDGVGKMGELISESKEMVEIIAIGPMTNFPTLLKRYPNVVHNARVYAMAGSINLGYYGGREPVAEYNVKVCIDCMEMLLQSNWSVTITPLDTCGDFFLNADELEHIFQVDNAPSRALSSTLVYFCVANTFSFDRCNLTVGTPVNYDMIATLLALPEVSPNYLVYSEMNLRVNGSGFTVRDDKMGAATSVALSWKENGQREFGDMFATLMDKEQN